MGLLTGLWENKPIQAPSSQPLMFDREKLAEGESCMVICNSIGSQLSLQRRAQVVLGLLGNGSSIISYPF